MIIVIIEYFLIIFFKSVFHILSEKLQYLEFVENLPQLTNTSRMIKNIAIYYPSLENFGGIESVILGQLNIFQETGYNILIITDIPVLRLSDFIPVKREVINSQMSRDSEWHRILTNNHIDVVLINGASFPSTDSDIEQIHSNGAKVVLTIHFSFPSPIIFTEAWDCYETNFNVGQKCDAVVTVSNIDKVWWTALGLNAHYIQNPFKVESLERHKIPHNTVIWVGRDTLQKQPVEPLKIISEVKHFIPDVKLLVIGPKLTKQTKKILNQLNIADNVEFHPNIINVSEYYIKANIYLLTSITESFCLTLAESKAHALPAVMYELPFLELTKSNLGIISVKQGDVKSASEAIVTLLKNPVLCNQKGEDARVSLTEFNDDQVLFGWKKLFNQLDDLPDKPSDNSDDINQIIVRQIFEAWKFQRSQNQYKIDFFQDYNKICSGRSLQKLFAKLIIPIQSLKNIFRKFK